MDIGLQEIFLISVIALLVLGPERLPVAIKTLAIWINRFRQSFNDIRRSIEQEINADEIRRQIHNENVLHELGETKRALDELESELEHVIEDEHHPDHHASDNPELEAYLQEQVGEDHSDQAQPTAPANKGESGGPGQ